MTRTTHLRDLLAALLAIRLKERRPSNKSTKKMQMPKKGTQKMQMPKELDREQ